jgi:hypothetical protein
VVQTPHDTLFAKSRIQLWCVLMRGCIGMPTHRYTVRPWVKAGLPPLQIFADASNGGAPSVSASSAATGSAVGATVRVAESDLALESPNPATVNEARNMPTPTLVGRLNRTPLSMSFRSRDISSSRTTPTRPRGKTVPLDYKRNTPEHEKDQDADSVLSFTPSVSSKHLANWFSGLLGR